MQFAARVGNAADPASCRRPVDQRETVIVDYSVDHGVVWTPLRLLDPFTLSTAPQVVNLLLPPAAKTRATVLRWWQPALPPGYCSADAIGKRLVASRCVFVCPRSYPRNCTSDLHQFFVPVTLVPYLFSAF